MVSRMRHKPLSLHPLTFDEAVTKLLQAKPEQVRKATAALKSKTGVVKDEEVVIVPEPKKRKVR